MNGSRLILLVASLECLVHYLHLFLLFFMVNYCMLRELDLGLLIEGLRLAVMKSRRPRVELMVQSLFSFLIRSHVVQFAVESRSFNIWRILGIHPRVFILIHHLTLLNQPAVMSDLALKVMLIS